MREKSSTGISAEVPVGAMEAQLLHYCKLLLPPHKSEGGWKSALENAKNLIENLLKNCDGLEEEALLVKEYDFAVKSKGEIDERVFLNEENSLLGSGSLSGGGINLSGSKRKCDSFASPVKSVTSTVSPHCGPGPTSASTTVHHLSPFTPVSTVMTTAKWFHRCMLVCSAELVLATHKTVALMFPAVLEKTGITSFDLSKVIEGLVRHEEILPRELKRHLNGLEEKLLESLAWEKGSALYNSLIVARPGLAGEIHRLGLLAEAMPSLDPIAANLNLTHGSVGLAPLPFPKIDYFFGDLQSPKRPRVEQRSLPGDQTQLNSPLREHLQTFCSPRKIKLLPLQSSLASPTRPNPAGGDQTRAETGIKIFFCKISKLMAIRIRTMCERMRLSQDILEKVLSLVQQILTQHTFLFFNRHIDQIISCSIYGVSKISNLSLTFKEIIFNYIKEPQCQSQLFRRVFIHWPSRSNTGKTGVEYVDIITFYNEVFVPSVKPLLVELGSSSQKCNK